MKIAKSDLALQFCWSYAELVESVREQAADVGLLGYALYHAGSLEIMHPSVSLDELTSLYQRTTTRAQMTEGLTAFAYQCIARNLLRYGLHLLERIDALLVRAPNGLRNCDGTIITPSSTTLDLAETLQRTGRFTIEPTLPGRGDTMDALVGALLFDASVMMERVAPEHLDVDRLQGLRTLLQSWVQSLNSIPQQGVPRDYSPSKYLACGAATLKAVVALGAMLRGTSLEQVRAERHRYLGVLPRLADDRPMPAVSDMTLAALPRPTQPLLRLCAGPGHTSTTGRLYIKMHQLVERCHDGYLTN